jgi:hypothetical protein
VPPNPLDKLGVHPERARMRESKGNTETAAVKPRAGIEEIARRCLFFVEMAWAGSANAPGPSISAVVN